jgi:RNA polymerase sigma-70 factor (ECF subfamily)
MNTHSASRLRAVFSAAPANTDLELIQAVAHQDRQAFKQLYERYAPRIGHYLLKLLKRPELVDEAVNDTMLAVWQNAERFDTSLGSLSTWLFGIAHNKGLKVLRQSGRFRADQPIDTLPPSALDEAKERDETPQAPASHTPERTVMGWELGEVLHWALQQLSPEHRSVIELTFGEELSYQEIATIVDCPLNTVKTRMFHARKKLAELLAQRGYRDIAKAED